MVCTKEWSIFFSLSPQSFSTLFYEKRQGGVGNMKPRPGFLHPLPTDLRVKGEGGKFERAQREEVAAKRGPLLPSSVAFEGVASPRFLKRGGRGMLSYQNAQVTREGGKGHQGDHPCAVCMEKSLSAVERFLRGEDDLPFRGNVNEADVLRLAAPEPLTMATIQTLRQWIRFNKGLHEREEEDPSVHTIYSKLEEILREAERKLDTCA